MKIKLLVLSVLSALPALAQAEQSAWRIEADNFAPVDAVVDIKEGRFMVAMADLAVSGLLMDKVPATDGNVDLNDIGTIKPDLANAILRLEPIASLLPNTNIDLASRGIFMKPAQPEGTFLNYDVRAQQTQGIGAESSLTGLLDGNTFVNGARVNVQAIARTNGTPASPNFERLSANLSKEDAETATTKLVGDGFAVAGAGVAPVRFIGVQYKKDYSLQPGFITSPVFNVSGAAASSSTVDVLLNNQVVRSQKIPAGPFSVSNLQPNVGASGATVIVTDAFGQQQIISQQIIGNPSLLREGLSDFAIQAGQIRPTLSRSESPFLSGFYRHGVEQNITLEGNAEASSAGSTLPAVKHVGLNAAISTAVGNFSLGKRLGSGSMTQAGYQNAWQKNGWNASASANIVQTTTDYTQMGGGLVAPLTKSIQGSLRHGNVGVNALYSKSNGLSLVTAGLVFSPAKTDGITWSANVTNLIGTTNSSTVMINASIPLDTVLPTPSRSHQASIGASQNAQQVVKVADYINRTTDTTGAAYRGHIEDSASVNRVDAYADYRAFQADVGVAGSTVRQQNNDTSAIRAYARGALVKAADSFGFTRWIDSGYSVVDTGEPGITVMVNGSRNAKTNDVGIAVVSGFPPFLKTNISLNSADLPDNFDDVTTPVSTYRRASGKIVKFRGHSQAMVSVPGHNSGILTVNGVDYPITDRGAYLELPEGQYEARVGLDIVHFSIPFSSNQLASVTAQVKGS